MKKDYSKYYTPLSVSSELVKLMTFKNNSKVIDICCGSGNLLKAARSLNDSLKCTGVDIFEKDNSIIKCDGREYAIKHKSEYDYSLANPPFGKTETKEYAEKLFSGKYESINSCRLEIEMLIANLIILKETGILLIILPSTIVKGCSVSNVRKVIAKNHHVSAIIDLPANAFFPEKINCTALIIEKQPNNSKETTYYHMNSSFMISKIYEISQKQMISGNWTGKLNSNTLEFSIKQGKISSNQFSNIGDEVLHTSKKSVEWQPSIRKAKICSTKNYLVVEKGDIIISRIGASAGHKCIYEDSPRYVSDCLFVIKSPSNIVKENLLKLDLTEIITGLSTPHITARDIYDLYYQTYKIQNN